MTPYNLLRKLSGLSQAEAADFHKVRPDTVKSWCAGRNPTPAGAVDEIRDLIAKQERAAQEALALYREKLAEHGPPAALDLYLGDKSWPTRSAQEMALARVAASVDVPVNIH